MRISTQQVFSNAITQMQTGQTKLAQTQERIASGKALLRPSDDPVAAAQILKLDRELARTDKFEENIAVSERRLGQEEIVLDQIDTATNRIKELTIQAGNTQLGDADRGFIANELRQLQQQILSLVNTKDAQGEYLFSGSQGHIPPFVQNGDGSFSYQGDDGQRFIQVGSELRIASSDSGRDAFQVIPGNLTLTSLGEATNRTGLVTGIKVTDNESLRAFTEQTGELTVAVAIGVGGYTYSVRDSAGAAVSGRLNGGAVDVPLDGLTLAAPPATDRVAVTTGKDVQGLEFDMDDLPGPPIAFNDTRVSVGVYEGVAPGEVESTALINATILTGSAPVGDEYSQFALLEGDLIVDFQDDGLGTPTSLTYSIQTTANPSPPNPLLQGPTVYVPGDTITIQDGAANDLIAVDINGAQGDGTSVTLRAQAEVTLRAEESRHSVLQTTQELITALELPLSGAASRQALGDAVANALTELNISKEGALKVRTQLGARLSSLASAKEINAEFKLFTETALSQLQDLDYAKAISEFSIQEMALQAAQATFGRVSQLSLFNFL